MKSKKIALAILASLAVSSAWAGVGADVVMKRLTESYPATKISGVFVTPIEGLYEVQMGRNIAYTDESGRYMIFGHIYDMKEQRDITADTLDAINRVDVSALPQADAIKTVRGKGERKLFVFSDPDCPYCKKLEQELAKVDNVTIYTFLYPLEGLHPEARKKAQAIWCAKDRAKVWEEFMGSGKLPAAGECETPIDRNLRLGNSFGINGTPTIIFANGAIAAGMIPAAEIERRLSGSRPMSGSVQRQ